PVRQAVGRAQGGGAVPLGAAGLLGPRQRQLASGRGGRPASRAGAPRLVPVHLPVHASWLNQVEIYFSILERKALTPADAASLEELAARILAFQARYEVLAQPFEWKFTRTELAQLLQRLAVRDSAQLSRAA